MKGIDISNYQAGLDLSTIAPAYDFAILKVTEGTTFTDRQFSTFYRAAAVPLGAYVYSHATTPEQAKNEAAFALNVIAGRKLPLGIYMDVETDAQMRLSARQLQDTVLAFCTVIRAAGYTPGLYGSEYNLWGKLSGVPSDVIRWVAHYGKKPEIDCDLWQSSDRGSVDGYTGCVDTDIVLSERFQNMVKPQVPDKPVQPVNFDPIVLCQQWCMYHDGYITEDHVTGIKDKTYREVFPEYAADCAAC